MILKMSPKLKVYYLPNVNDKIYTIVTSLHQFENMYLLKGENYVNDKKLMECNIKLVGMMSKRLSHNHEID